MDNLTNEIETILDEHVRPKLAEHSGNVSVADIRNGIVYVRLTGHCSHCPSAMYTLEDLIKEEILNHTKSVQDVKLQEEVSQELYDLAKDILRNGRKLQG